MCVFVLAHVLEAHWGCVCVCACVLSVCKEILWPRLPFEGICLNIWDVWRVERRESAGHLQSLVTMIKFIGPCQSSTPKGPGDDKFVCALRAHMYGPCFDHVFQVFHSLLRQQRQLKRLLYQTLSKLHFVFVCSEENIWVFFVFFQWNIISTPPLLHTPAH